MDAPSASVSQGLIPAARLKELLPELLSPQEATGIQFLKLQLAADLTVAIALDWVEESLLLESQAITPIPNMPPYVTGLMSSKGRVFWIVDFMQLLGLKSEAELLQNSEVVIIRVVEPSSDDEETEATGAERFLGLIIPKISGTIRLNEEEIISPTVEVDASFHPYLSGQASVDAMDLLVLSADAIGRSQIFLKS